MSITIQSSRSPYRERSGARRIASLSSCVYLDMLPLLFELIISPLLPFVTSLSSIRLQFITCTQCRDSSISSISSISSSRPLRHCSWLEQPRLVLLPLQCHPPPSDLIPHHLVTLDHHKSSYQHSGGVLTCIYPQLPLLDGGHRVLI